MDEQVDNAGTVTGEGESAGAPEATAEATFYPTMDEVEVVVEEEEEGKPESPDSPSAQERIRQLAEEGRANREELEKLKIQIAEREAKPVEEPKDFVEIDMEKVETFVQETQDKIEELRLDGKGTESIALMKELIKFTDKVDAELAKAESWKNRQQTATQTKQFEEAEMLKVQESINRDSAIIMKSENITPEAWQAGREFFDKACEKDEALAREYSERVWKDGTFRAIKWATEYVKQHLGKEQQAATQKKEAAKKTVPSGKSNTGIKPVENSDDALLKAFYPSMYNT